MSPTQPIDTQQLAVQAIDFVNQFDYPAWIYTVKNISIILSWIFLILLVILIFRIRRLAKDQLLNEPTNAGSPGQGLPQPAVSAYDNRWAEIKRHVNSFNEAEWKLAVIEADKFVDDALKTGGYPGESMGERLMLIEPGQLLSLQNLWDAHKLRNLLVHDPNYQLTHRQAVLAVEAFEQTLQELGALS